MNTLNPTEQSLVRTSIKQIVDAKTRIAAENDLVKELTKKLKEDFDIAPKITRRTAMALFRQNLTEELTDIEDIESLYEVSK